MKQINRKYRRKKMKGTTGQVEEKAGKSRNYQ
jgi:hypothetical protein